MNRVYFFVIYIVTRSRRIVRPTCSNERYYLWYNSRS